MIVRFEGGLGNQMFQYAIYYMGKKKGYDVSADCSFYESNIAHNGLEIEKIFGIELNKTNIQYILYKQDILSKTLRKLGLNFSNNDVIKENKAKYIPNLLTDKNKHKYLFGYWQSEKYFCSIRSEILSSFKFPNLGEKSQKMLDMIQSTNSIAMHIRRGDYILAKIYENLGESKYYENAMNYFENRFENITYFIFSDDLTWCKNNLRSNKRAIFVDCNKGRDSFFDMKLMSHCKHNIIANSSFSWWGAWLNDNPNKIVLAPHKWFTRMSGYDDTNIVPESWIKV